MRVAIVVERWRHGGGGVEGQAAELVRGLRRRGVAVTVVARRFESPLPEGTAAIRVPVPRAWQPARVVLFALGAARAVERERFDLVHSFARTLRHDLVRTGGGSHLAYLEAMHRRPALAARTPRHAAILALERRGLADPRALVQCNARRNAVDLVTRYGVGWERIRVLPNGVDATFFHPGARRALRAEARRALGLGEEPVALFVGHGFRRKGLDRALAGLARAPAGTTLLVAGRDRAAPWAALARRLGVAARVRFLGAVADLRPLHAAADLLVLPTRYDPFANACLEAMASGLPVATTPTNGAAELLDAATGVVVEDAWEELYRPLASPAWCAHAGEAARAVAEALDFARHVEATLALYEDVRKWKNGISRRS